MTHCLTGIAKHMANGTDPYVLIDLPLEGIRRLPLTDSSDVPWSAEVNVSVLNGFLTRPWTTTSYAFNRAEWLLPKDYKEARSGEVRVVFVHGGNLGEDALGSDYAGMTTRLANWTGLPVFAFDYATEPLVTWPNNLRSVLSYLEYAASHGPLGAAPAGKLVLVADSEGTLVLMQTVISMYDPFLRTLLGSGDILPPPQELIGGIILSSPVIDISCRTPSMGYNCFNYTDPKAPLASGTGDPDTGNCSSMATFADKSDDCLWSYLEYFFGFKGLVLGQPTITGKRGAATAEVRRRSDFFSQPHLSPLTYNLNDFPPMLILTGTRDYFYSDGPTLGARACESKVPVEVINVYGGFHDFIEYSEGCGKGVMTEEAIYAYSRIASFTSRLLTPSPPSPPAPPPSPTPPSPSPSPVQPPPVPGWVAWLLHNTFGGAFGGSFLAVLVCALIALLGWACLKVINRKCNKRSRARGGSREASILGFAEVN